MWRDVVEEFTSRSLTFSDDKLPAIAGLASAVSQACPGILSTTNYMFGLWRKDLIHHLLWCRVNDGTSTERLSQNKAPSWSWASLSHGPVYYPADTTIVDWFCEEWEFIDDCQILSVHCSPSTPNIFGPGTGRIKFEGTLRQVTLDHLWDISRPVTSRLSSADMNLIFDVHTDADLDQSYYVLILGRVMRKEKRRWLPKKFMGFSLLNPKLKQICFIEWDMQRATSIPSPLQGYSEARHAASILFNELVRFNWKAIFLFTLPLSRKVVGLPRVVGCVL
jgi:hypothetical protein